MNASSRLKLVIGTFLLIAGLPAWCRGDEVQTTTGDHYQGSIITLTNGTLVLKNEVLGVVKIPRSKIARMSFGDAPSAVSREKAPTTNPPPVALDKDTQKALAQLGTYTNLIQGIQSKFLADASPEANDKFSQMVNGLLSGKLSVGDIRAEAASAAAQLREARKELGEESDFAIDSYLAILDRFLANSSDAKSAAPKSK